MTPADISKLHGMYIGVSRSFYIMYVHMIKGREF